MEKTSTLFLNSDPRNASNRSFVSLRLKTTCLFASNFCQLCKVRKIWSKLGKFAKVDFTWSSLPLCQAVIREARPVYSRSQEPGPAHPPSIHSGLPPIALQLLTREYTTAAVIPAKQEALSSPSQRPDCILDKVLVNAEATVIHVTPQPRHQRQRILDSLAYTALLI